MYRLSRKGYTTEISFALGCDGIFFVNLLFYLSLAHPFTLAAGVMEVKERQGVKSEQKEAGKATDPLHEHNSIS